MIPDFAEFLFAVPESDRHGRVFKLNRVDTGARIVSDKMVSKKLSEIGKKTRVVVDKHNGKYASAHDFRRAFGTWWAKRVAPAVLQKLMRHSNIKTTMEFYVGLDADDQHVSDAPFEQTLE